MEQNQVTAVVLAGGGSRRMGYNKALLRLGNETMVERTVNLLKKVFQEVIVITDTPEIYSFLKGVVFYPDVFQLEERNSMIGIYSGLLKASFSKAFVVACDMPFLNMELLLYMKKELDDEDILIPFVNCFYEPLHAFYSKSCLQVFEDCLKTGKYKVTATFNNFQTKKVDESVIRKYDPKLLSFTNINTCEEYNNICQQFKG